MRVGIDVRPMLSRKTGVGRYLGGLVPALVRAGVEVVAFSSSFRERFDPARLPGVDLVDRMVPVRLLDRLWLDGRGPAFERLAREVDVVHSPTPLPLPTRGAARVVTVHDLFFLSFPHAVAGQTRDWADRVRHAVNAAEAVICVSETTAAATAALLGVPAARLHAVPHGLEPGWFEPLPPETARAARARLGVDGRYFVAVGALEVRKNYPRLLGALDRVRRAGHRDVRLVIAGPDGPDRREVDRLVATLELRSAVHFAGYQEDATLKALYQGAVALVMPSLDEGFGFPVLEAMALGCPVVAAEAGAVPEVAGDAALFVEPREEESILEGMLLVLERAGIAQELREAGRKRARSFTWEEAARRTIAVYDAARVAAP